MDRLPDLAWLSHAEKDALIHALWAQVQALTARVAELEAKLDLPPKTPDNSSLPPSRGKKPNRDNKPARTGPRQGSLGRTGGGRVLAEAPDETVTARPSRCAHCQAALDEADQALASRFDKVDLPMVTPVVTRVERYAGHCRCCGGTTLAPLPAGLEPGTPFSGNIVALAMYLRFVHHVSYRRLSRLLLELFGLAISEGALDAAFRRGKPHFDAETAAILVRLRRARLVCSDETGVRIDGRTCWNWVSQNDEVAIHVVRHSRSAGVVAEVMAGHRPAIWVSDLYSAQRGHAEALADLSGASAPRLSLRHRGGRYHLRATHEGAAAARRGAGPAASELGREHPPRVPPPPRACARCGHGARSRQPPRAATAKALRQAARAPLHLPRPPRGDGRQQRQ